MRFICFIPHLWEYWELLSMIGGIMMIGFLVHLSSSLCWDMLVKRNTAGPIQGRSFSLRSSWHRGQDLGFPWGSEKHECLDKTGLSTLFQRRFPTSYLFFGGERQPLPGFQPIIDLHKYKFVYVETNKTPLWVNGGKCSSKSIIKDNKSSHAQI